MENREAIALTIQEAFEKLTPMVGFQKMEDWHGLITTGNISAALEDGTTREGTPLIVLNREFEDRFFEAIFTFDDTGFIYHYTALGSAFSILSGQVLRMSSIAGMNDRTEVDSTVSVLKEQIKSFRRNTLRSASERFILACSNKEDDLTQWRLYGDDGRGACLEFRIEKPLSSRYDFTLGRVMYGQKLLRTLQEVRREVYRKYQVKLKFRRLFLWKHFIKPIDYRDEEEIRLLYFNDTASEDHKKRKWKLNKHHIVNAYVEFNIYNQELPLTLLSVRLGPKCPEKRLNRRQIELFLKDQQLSHISVELSKLSHYR